MLNKINLRDKLKNVPNKAGNFQYAVVGMLNPIIDKINEILETINTPAPAPLINYEEILINFTSDNGVITINSQFTTLFSNGDDFTLIWDSTDEVFRLTYTKPSINPFADINKVNIFITSGDIAMVVDSYVVSSNVIEFYYYIPDGAVYFDGENGYMYNASINIKILVNPFE